MLDRHQRQLREVEGLTSSHDDLGKGKRGLGWDTGSKRGVKGGRRGGKMGEEGGQKGESWHD